MLFNSISFLLFFPIIVALFWATRYALKGDAGVKVSNILLLIGSYYFYMCWSVEYVMLLFAATFITYLAGLAIARGHSDCVKKSALVTSIVLNFSILFVFKYLGFATKTVVSVMDILGIRMTVPDFGILLPVGISFYIFQSVGYAVDVYRGKIEAETDLLTYALFVSFFPQLVAGPIERSSNLLPQFKRRTEFDYDSAIEGVKLMVWGYFMKLVMADRCAEYTDQIFNHLHYYTGSTYLMAGIVFAFQIYGDFAGYSMIAIGASKIMGFNLMKNFEEPYLSWSISNFWRRWHISLSTWFKDYIYIPLGGNRSGQAKCYRNLMITFVLSGIWHGANLTFIVWGALHGLLQCLERLIGWHKKQWQGFAKVWHTLLTFTLVMLLFMIFRSDTIENALHMLGGIFVNFSAFYMPYDILFYLIVGIGVVMFRDASVAYNLPIHISDSKYAVVRFGYIVAMIVMVVGLGSLNGSKFIYFQF